MLMQIKGLNDCVHPPYPPYFLLVDSPVSRRFCLFLLKRNRNMNHDLHKRQVLCLYDCHLIGRGPFFIFLAPVGQEAAQGLSLTCKCLT